ncbi:SH3 domain-containing protein [Hoeflea sp.]|uniref:SH3 domain-containing protein n=1 Tax=Hoeflea sp. TaxID=1940281 RepID=UPI003B51E375
MRPILQCLSFACLFAALAPLTLMPALSQALDVPVMERANEDLDTCALGQVAGLKVDGDGFLAVRSGPDSGHAKLDELSNGDRVWLFDRQGEWIGIAYGVEELSCSPVETDREVKTDGKKGWVHEKWIEVLAG